MHRVQARGAPGHASRCGDVAGSVGSKGGADSRLVPECIQSLGLAGSSGHPGSGPGRSPWGVSDPFPPSAAKPDWAGGRHPRRGGGPHRGAPAFAAPFFAGSSGDPLPPACFLPAVALGGRNGSSDVFTGDGSAWPSWWPRPPWASPAISLKETPSHTGLAQPSSSKALQASPGSLAFSLKIQPSSSSARSRGFREGPPPSSVLGPSPFLPLQGLGGTAVGQQVSTLSPCGEPHDASGTRGANPALRLPRRVRAPPAGGRPGAAPAPLGLAAPPVPEGHLSSVLVFLSFSLPVSRGRAVLPRPDAQASGSAVPLSGRNAPPSLATAASPFHSCFL